MGISTLTGPAGALMACVQACFRTSSVSSADRTRYACLLTALSMPSWSGTSCTAPVSRPRWAVALCPVMCSKGVPAKRASTRPGTVLEAPGPVLLITTPIAPVARASPSAMCAAPVSPRVITMRIRLFSVMPSIMGMLWTEIMPKTVSTPLWARKSATRCPARYFDIKLLPQNWRRLARSARSWNCLPSRATIAPSSCGELAVIV